ncbi:fatty acid hydroxylase-like protein 2 [Elsinoe australis]|uniref:Fatty acid hydroxylase-like protein 2 n=1 Tax=Elsinoe australis TaxID=40998 RepID=A0A4U7ATG7_9PEZI|nr:fatty acid hydroxylase-like protein 2 [Elsinoe australis]
MSLQTQLEQLRDSALYSLDKLLGRAQPTWSDRVYKAYGYALVHAGSVLSLPMTILSFLAIPFFGGTTTSINLLFFYLTWSALIWTHSPRAIEMYGILAIKLLTFLLPGYGFLAFDYLLPGASASMKAGGRRQLPAKLGQQKLLHVAGWATFNVLLGIGLQLVLEWVFATFGYRSCLRVTMSVPLPWTMAKELVMAFIVRGILHYIIHRFILHAPSRSQFAPVAKLHRQWAHGNKFIFSLCAAYDHPACYLLVHWLPSYLPAYFWRMHVLTWLMFQTVVSLEALLIYSGYSALPSAIMLPGMARRVDKHFATGGRGNFGHWGVLDLVCRTGCAGESDIMDDLQDEADKHQVKRRMSDAVDDAGDFIDGGKEKMRRGRRRREEKEDISEQEEEDSEEDDEDYEPPEEEEAPKKKKEAQPTRPPADSTDRPPSFSSHNFPTLYFPAPPSTESLKALVTDSETEQPPAFAPAPPFQSEASSSSLPNVVAETKAALPRDTKEGPSKGDLDDGEPPPPYTEGSSPIDGFTYVMAAAGGAASIITQVQQSGPAPINTLQGSSDEHINLDLRGTRFTLSRDELLTLPEFVLLSLFPNGLLPEGHMNSFHESDVYPVDVSVPRRNTYLNTTSRSIASVASSSSLSLLLSVLHNPQVYLSDILFPSQYDPASLSYMLDFFRNVASTIPTQDNADASPFSSPHPSERGSTIPIEPMAGNARDMLQDRAGIIVLREDLDFYAIPPRKDIEQAEMMEVKRAAGKALLRQDGIFSGLRKSEEPGTTEQHLIEMLTAGGFNHSDTWGHRAGEPNKAVICSIALARLRTDAANGANPAAQSNAVGMAQKLLLFWRKPARRCWWEGVDLDNVEGVEGRLKVWIRRVWTLEMW